MNDRRKSATLRDPFEASIGLGGAILCDASMPTKWSSSEYHVPLSIVSADNMSRNTFPRAGWSLAERKLGILAGIATAMMCAATHADDFANVYYSAAKDQLVVTMAYRGTNPDHIFTLKWGPCQKRSGGSSIAAELLDSQWQDEARSDFKKTTRFALANIPCRPAQITLKSAPRFFVTLHIPASNTAKP